MIQVYDLAGATPSTSTLTSPPWPPATGTLVCDQGNPTNCNNGTNGNTDNDAQNAYKNALDFYNFFADHFGRDSIDDAGGTVKATVHYDTFSYGDLGDPNTKDTYQRVGWLNALSIANYRNGVPAATDLAAHAIYNGFPESGALLDTYQPGAIKQSLGDIWGEFIEQHNGAGSESFSDNWLIGENSPAGAVRNMKNPPQFLHPDKMTSTYYALTNESDADPAGTSRKNAGVNNKAAFLMTSGGSFNYKTVSALGYLKVAHIYYEVETSLLASASTYFDLYYAIQQACVNLTGQDLSADGTGTITSADCTQVKNALDAVQMNKTKTGVILPSYCPTGTLKANTDLFRATSSTITDQWTLSNADAADQWEIQENESVRPESGFRLHADDVGHKSSAILQITTPVVLPVNSNPFLYFRQRTDFEFSGTNYYDGGILQYRYSTDGGATWAIIWTDAAPLFSAGKNYGGFLKTGLGVNGLNTLYAGKKAFVGFTSDYVPSLYKLITLAGKSVQFRWIMASDAQNGTTLGWDLDDISIYECVTSPSIPALLTPASGALMTNLTPTLDWTDSSPYLDHYQLQVWTSSVFPADTSAVVDATIPVTLPLSAGSVYSIPGGTLNLNTKYYWHVRSYNSAGDTKGWSATRYLRTPLPTPVLSSPPDDPSTSLFTTRPDFDWGDSIGATGYTIQIAKNISFISTSIALTASTTGVTASKYTPTIDLPRNMTLYWRVKANGTNPSIYSTSRSFKTGNSPTVPVLVSPATNAQVLSPYTPMLKWKPVTLAPPVGSTTFYYFQVQVDDNSDFSSPAVNDTSVVNNSCLPACPSLTIPALTLNPGTKYYWRVRAFINEGGPDFSGWSPVWNFRAAIAAPTLLFPVAGQGSGVLRPVFDWNNPTGATGYVIQVDDISTFGSPLFTKTITTATSQYQWTSDLPGLDGKVFYWRVKATGPNGASPYSATGQFVKHLPPAPAISLDKSVSSGDNYDTAGGTVGYSYLVTNTGNITLTSIVVTDDNLTDNATMSCPATSLMPGNSLTCSASHTVTLADLDAGTVTSIGRANASSTAGAPTEATDTATATADQNPEMTLTKSEAAGPDSSPYALGKTITYSIEVENTGNITLNNVTVTDSGAVMGSCSPVSGSSLAPLATMTCAATHVVTQSNVNAGSSYSNTATGHSTEVTATNSNTLVSTLDQGPALGLVNSITSGNNYTAVGQTISYRYVVTNTGNAALTGVSVTDDTATTDCTGDPLTSVNTTSPSNHDGNGFLDPDEAVTCTGSYTVTQADLNDATTLTQDSVTNQATAHATATGTIDSDPDTATSAALFLAEDISSGDPFHYAGDVVNYTFTVANNTSISRPGPITVTDDTTTVSCPNVNTVGNNNSNLDPGESVTCTASYPVTSTDVSSGSIQNFAIAQASDGTSSNRVTKIVAWSPALNLIKSITSGNPYTAVGNIIQYSYSVQNTGSISLVGLVTVTDDKTTVSCPNVNTVGNNNSNLDFGETVVCTASYTIIQADLDNHSVVNNATAHAGGQDSNQATVVASGP
jgi:hypothetical protein